MPEENSNNLRDFYNPIKERCGPNFKELNPGTYGLGYIIHGPVILNDDIVLELSFSTRNLTEETKCSVNIWYYFPQPCSDNNQLIRGLQRLEDIVFPLENKDYESNFRLFGRSYESRVRYHLKKKVGNKEDVEQVFQELSALESSLMRLSR